ncbi:MAG TPA: LamG domain-containing protein [Kofleriaceae bacterium]|nr:LamG domain-containing protein [Kofleriaceae bacterium]
MQRVVWLAVVLAACRFEPPDAVQADGAPGMASDDGGASSQDGGPSSIACRTVDATGAVLCLDFEQTTMDKVIDRSGLGHDATATNVASERHVQPPFDEGAAAFSAMSQLTIGATPDLDLRSFTIEMWILPAQPVPIGSRYFLFDASDQYFLSLGDDQELRCGFNGGISVDSNDAFPHDGMWHHVACTYDAANRGELRVYLDGNLSDCERTDLAIFDMPGGTFIGGSSRPTQPLEHFLGVLDNVHVYGRAMTPAQVCAAAGATGCAASCPSGNTTGI